MRGQGLRLWHTAVDDARQHDVTKLMIVLAVSLYSAGFDIIGLIIVDIIRTVQQLSHTVCMVLDICMVFMVPFVKVGHHRSEQARRFGVFE